MRIMRTVYFFLPYFSSNFNETSPLAISVSTICFIGKCPNVFSDHYCDKKGKLGGCTDPDIDERYLMMDFCPDVCDTCGLRIDGR